MRIRPRETCGSSLVEDDQLTLTVDQTGLQHSFGPRATDYHDSQCHLIKRQKCRTLGIMITMTAIEQALTINQFLF